MKDSLAPPIRISDVPAKYNPESLPCQGGCLYADCMHAAPHRSPPFEMIRFKCAPRQAANGFSSWTFATMCDLERCPWTQAQGNTDREADLLAVTARAIASIEDPRQRGSNVTSDNWRRATIKAIFEYQEPQPL